jgi:hypothetical protein
MRHRQRELFKVKEDLTGQRDVAQAELAEVKKALTGQRDAAKAQRGAAQAELADMKGALAKVVAGAGGLATAQPLALPPRPLLLLLCRRSEGLSSHPAQLETAVTLSQQVRSWSNALSHGNSRMATACASDVPRIPGWPQHVPRDAIGVKAVGRGGSGDFLVSRVVLWAGT